jgi:anti-anti-sigma factor
MLLSLEHRHVGDAVVVTCTGRITAGAESEALRHYLDGLAPRSPHIVLHLGGVEFIDSGGLGLLVRYVVRAKHGTGNLTVCSVSQKVKDVLNVTKLGSVVQPHETEEDAIAYAHHHDRSADAAFLNANVLCVHRSADVLAYVRELLKGAGYRVITAQNLPDALILLTATQPGVVVVDADLRASRATRTAGEFNRLADGRAVVELPQEFSSHDAGEAAEELLRGVRASINAKQ